MPLSKARMRARKRQDRFDKQHLSPYQANPVKPKPIEDGDDPRWFYCDGNELDADGQPIPDY